MWVEDSKVSEYVAKSEQNGWVVWLEEIRIRDQNWWVVWLE